MGPVTDPAVIEDATRDEILMDMEHEIEAAVMRARLRLRAIESSHERSPEQRDESAPTPAH